MTMPLEPYQYQPTTPEATPSPRFDSYSHGRKISGASAWSTPDSDLSLVSAATHLTTPNASPQKLSAHNILPKIRTQDQNLEPDYYVPIGHRRAQSHDVDAQTISLSYRPGYQRSTTSPPDFSTEAAPPLSNASTLSPWDDSAADSPQPYSVIGHEHYGHGRSISTSSIDHLSFRPIGNPCYLTFPEFRTQESAQDTPTTMLSNSMNQSMSFQPNEFVDPGLADPFCQELRPELTWMQGDDWNAVSTIKTYLTEPNPHLDLVPETPRGFGNGKFKHFWWDVRNIRAWDDFNISAISQIPGLSSLTDQTMKLAALPQPAPLTYSASHPQDLSSLGAIIKNFHIAKVNAALKASTRGTHITMTLNRTPEDGSYFVSNLANEASGTLGNRGKCVGLVKPFHRWDSGKQKEVGQKRVEYLQHLAHLQVLMRAHNCRYGFIITEIELVCVRLGSQHTTPHFGHLELCRPIPMTKHASSDGPKPHMTVCLALWYLNILAKDGHEFGHPNCRIDVGPPEAHSRSKVLSKGVDGRDPWMPKVQMYEMRQAKSLRGWAWPEDPVHRIKEGVGSKRGARR